MIELRKNLERIRERIERACVRSGRLPDSVLLLPASKRRYPNLIHTLYNLGLRDFGESRVQELLKKKDELPEDIRWHFIGHLQSNKARQIAPFVHCVHSIDSVETASELSRRAEQHSRRVRVLFEVNISGEEQRNGTPPNEIEQLVLEVATNCTSLIPVGLMGMASFADDPERTRPQFRALRELRDKIAERHPELNAFTELSMGMSNDYEVAVEEGATIVRIGSALFG
jgi:pyridoxal phosphate enzyme (YggS family)